MAVRSTVEARLEGLEAKLLQIGQQVQGQLSGALDALAGGDLTRAEEVVAGDDAIDHAYVEVEQEILLTLALHAPIARDLRVVTAVLHINSHLERMGDLCVNLAKCARFLAAHPPIPEVQATLAEMGAYAQRLIAAAMTCFARRDAQLAESLPRLDEPLDRLNQQVFRQIERAAEEDRALEWAGRVVLAARFLERLGDHSVDIGEQVGFIVTGEVREFLPPKSARGPSAGSSPAALG